jgi:hypothetical protein
MTRFDWLRRKRPEPALTPEQARIDKMAFPAIVHVCPNCHRAFDSPSVCMEDGSVTQPQVRDLPRDQYDAVGADRTAEHQVSGWYSGPMVGAPQPGTSLVGCRCGWASEPHVSIGPPMTALLDHVREAAR